MCWTCSSVDISFSVNQQYCTAHRALWAVDQVLIYWILLGLTGSTSSDGVMVDMCGLKAAWKGQLMCLWELGQICFVPLICILYSSNKKSCILLMFMLKHISGYHTMIIIWLKSLFLKLDDILFFTSQPCVQRAVCQDASRQHEILKADNWEHDLTMNHHDERGCLFIFMTDTGCSMQTVYFCHGLNGYVVFSVFNLSSMSFDLLLMHHYLRRTLGHKSQRSQRTEVFTVCCRYVSK